MLKKLTLFNIILLGLISLSIATIDRPLSNFIEENLTSLKPFFNYLTVNSDYIVGFILYKLFGSLPFFLLFCFVVGLICLLSRKTKLLGFFLLTMIFAYPATTILTNIMKMEFRRARPEIYLQGNESTLDFHSDQMPNDSFPSGHAALYLSLFLPGAMAYRNYAPYFLVIPGMIIFGRVVQNYHYLSDVLFSVVFAFNLCLLVYWLLNCLDRTLTKIINKLNRKRKAADNNTFTASRS